MRATLGLPALWVAAGLAAGGCARPAQPQAPAATVHARAAPAAPAEPAAVEAANTEQAEPPAALRRSWKGDARLRPLARSLGARPVAIDGEAALQPFFAALDGLAGGAAERDVVVAAIGNSIIASDKVVDRVREGLVALFGSGGRGALLADRIGSYGPRTRTGITGEGTWQPRHLGELEPLPHAVALTGVYHAALADGARSWFRLKGEREVTLWWQDVVPGAAVQVRADDQLLLRPTPRGDGSIRTERVALPEGARALQLVAEKAGVTVQGVVLDAPERGVVLDTFGVPSADATFWLKADAAAFADQLAQRQPALLLFVLGGNEVKRVQWGKRNLAEVERSLAALLQRAKQAAPQAGCLLVGPLAATDPQGEVDFAERRPLKPVIALQRKVALEQGCAFYDLYEAMGGDGALKRFAEAGILHDDRVHPRSDGLDLLGDLVARAVIDAWRAAAEAAPARAGVEARR